MDCSINSGRLDVDCLSKMAGVRTFFFMHYADLDYSLSNGIIVGLAPAIVYRFEQEIGLGNTVQDVVRGQGDTIHTTFKSEGYFWKTRPQDLKALRALTRGRWAIFFEDYEKNIRMFGAQSAMTTNGGVGLSGELADSDRWAVYNHIGRGEDFAPFLAPYTEFPFDNYPITVLPPYTTDDDLIYNSLDDKYLVNVTDILDYNG